MTRLAAIEGRRQGGGASWVLARRLWQARRPAVAEPDLDEAVMIRALEGPVDGPLPTDGMGWPFWRARLLAARRRALPPVTTWDLRWETQVYPPPEPGAL